MLRHRPWSRFMGCHFLFHMLKTMESYGLVHFEKRPGRQLAPRVNYSGVKLEMIFQ